MTDPDHVLRNRLAWNSFSAEYAARAPRAWSKEEAEWGIWHIPEGEVGLLSDVEGKDVLENGCGTAYVSAWAARRGARVVGLDNSPAQLGTARHMQREHDLHFPLVHGIAERLPFANESFDLVLSEYGAAIWADPRQWIPEASRVLRAGGELAFLGNATILMLCMPDLDEEMPAKFGLVRDYFGLYRIEWPEEKEGIEFHLGYGDWIRLFRDNEFEIVDLIELRAPEGAATDYDFVTAEWASRWPSEQIWRVRKIGDKEWREA